MLGSWRDEYNHGRPHRGIGRAGPRGCCQAGCTTPPARP
ncbi:MAG: hypothetical protein B7Y47_02355 [Sphingomonas sp. 28-63-12]|nr:MAG: hypothetical protein B7Y47_02355 [Sphingomonas sp. 28-63-12]